MLKQIPQILIGAASSGSGKTTFTLGLIRALCKRGMIIQPFKCGPDYIDTQYHYLASTLESVNLDSFMQSNKHIKELYTKYGSLADGCIIEGVMGLFDGYDKIHGSSANIAEILNIPVLLIINAKASGYSVAPIIAGFKNFRKRVKIAGVVFNMVGGESHYKILKDACESVGVKSFGFIPKNNKIEIPSRHLGLSLDEKFKLNGFIDNLADIIEQHIDIDAIIEAYTKPVPDYKIKSIKRLCLQSGKMRISIARDEAFNFTYKENIAVLEKIGKVSYFSPLNDTHLPTSDFVYLPGGYPELFLEKLSANTAMLSSIKEYVMKGGKMLAECGGMMYLCKSVKGISTGKESGKEYKMCGIIDEKVTMENMRLHIGYRAFNYNNIEVRGHEFHYSGLIDKQTELGFESDNHDIVIINAKGEVVGTKLFRYKNLIASYVHIYWGEFNPINLF